jgi:hypothetical protein
MTAPMNFKPGKFYVQTEGTVKRIVFHCVSTHLHPITEQLTWFGFSAGITGEDYVSCSINEGSSTHLRGWAEAKWSNKKKTWEKK